jgi:hypothetical protein
VRGEERCVECLVGKVEGKRLIGRQRSRWGDNIKMKKSGKDWRTEFSRQAEDWRAVVNAELNIHVPYNAGNFWTS